MGATGLARERPRHRSHPQIPHKHGRYSQAAIQGRRECRAIIRTVRELIGRADSDPDDVVDALATLESQ
jgi:hypothetical protein